MSDAGGLRHPNTRANARPGGLAAGPGHLPAHERALAHARALQARGSALPPDGLPGEDVLDSWARCITAGLRFEAAPRIEVIGGAELAERRERAEFVRRLAQAELETLAQQIAGSNHLLAFADADGVILDLYADNRFRMSGPGAGIVAGSWWSEARAGTNGLGTALVRGRPIAVSGLEHFHLSLGQITCTAAPIRDARGALVGVLDASSYFESRQRHTLALVQMSAVQIENSLLLHQMREHVVLALHPRSEFLHTLSVGLLAFDDGGQLLALNSRGRELLTGLDAAPGSHFDALFGEPMAALLSRIALSGEARLRDLLGSTLVARCVNRPPRTAVAPQAAGGARTAARAVAAPMPAPAADAAPVQSIRGGRGAAAGRAPAAPTPVVVAEDPAVREAIAVAEGAVRLGAPLLIEGDTGTGKELLARHAHAASGRGGGFVAVNCAALPAELFEAELFGYAGGAYTGARREGSAGLVAAADGGTLLLDEVRDLPLPMQAALLRFLDDHSVRPVGGVHARRVDVQVIAASNVPLAREVEAHRFRADLYYRLQTVHAVLPPLAARQDFEAAVRATLAGLDAAARIDAGALARLARHPWPGNFRELRAVLTRALLAAGPGARLGAAQVEPLLPAGEPAAASALRRQTDSLIRQELERCGGSVSEAARRLGISRTTIYRHLRGG